jgi:uncharacterized glyoxalase superfamily protein PhnB
VFQLAAAREDSLICASIETDDVHALFEAFRARGAPIAQPPTRQAWGGTDLHIPDPDGNVIAFVEYGR